MASITRFLTAISSLILSTQLTVKAATVIRQVADPNGPIAGWTSVGCFTDRGAARTLRADFMTNNITMTPAVCTQFCSDSGQGFAGLEDGQDCWCDGVIQLTANQTDVSACNAPCTGDGTLLCGGHSRIEIFTDGAPSPAILTDTEDDIDESFWQYVGCYADSPNRILGRLVGPASSLESCTLLCAAEQFNSSGRLFFTFAGLENGDECWCDTSVNGNPQRLPDIACESMACTGNPSEACGGPLVMALYQQPSTEDVASDDFNPRCRPGFSLAAGLTFTLEAVFKDEPNTSIPITLATLNPVIDPFTNMNEAIIISACPTCDNPPLIFTSVPNNQDLFVAVNATTDLTGGLTVAMSPGGTTNFEQIVNPDVTVSMDHYCLVFNPLDPSNTTFALSTELLKGFATILSPTVMTLDPFAPFALCANNTVEGRLDVVWKGLENQLGYNLSDCRDVVIPLNVLS